MANFSMEGLDDIMKQLNDIADLSEIAPKMVDAATPTLAENLQKNIKREADRGYATGELAGSVKPYKAKLNQYGCFAAVTVTGTDKKGVRNAEKLAYMEYGTSKQQAHPVMQKTINESEDKCVEKMQEVFEREVGW